MLVYQRVTIILYTSIHWSFMGFGGDLMLVGGLEHEFHFFHILGIIKKPTDFHIFQRDWNHQPAINLHQFTGVSLMVEPFHWWITLITLHKSRITSHYIPTFHKHRFGRDLMGCQWGFLLGIFLRIHEVEATWNHESWAILMGKPLIQPDVRTARTANPATVLRTAKLVVADGAFQKVGSQWVCNQMIMTWVCLQTFKLREPQIDAPCFECEENCTVKRTCSEYWGRIRNPEYRQFFSRAASQCRKHHAFFLAALFIFWAQTLMCLPKCNSLFFPWCSVVQSIPEIDIFFWINMLERAKIAEVEFWMF